MASSGPSSTSSSAASWARTATPGESLPIRLRPPWPAGPGLNSPLLLCRVEVRDTPMRMEVVIRATQTANTTRTRRLQLLLMLGHAARRHPGGRSTHKAARAREDPADDEHEAQRIAVRRDGHLDRQLEANDHHEVGQDQRG